ncbi:hypothetical protein, partial [Roseisolibacter sp. H3M3-2]|uniref:hypothetical protein n=1 Tax=Roseisolibacter sp. H3M3-2 TaxID=3031323 RepID=UPI0023DBBF1C
MPRRLLPALAASVLATAVVPRAASAQPALRGVVWDSLAGAPLADALVQFAPGADPGAAAWTARPDGAVRWRIDALPAGEYVGAIFHPTLDALGLTPPSCRVRAAADAATVGDFALPGARRLRRLLCGGEAAARDFAVVLVGEVRDADTDEPVADARVSLAWRELAVERGIARWVARTHAIATGAGGTYIACGVPDTDVTLEVRAPGRASGRVDVAVPGHAVVRRDLTVGAAPDDAP